MRHTRESVLLELCAGAGGPGLAVSDAFAEAGFPRPRVVLTDRYPNIRRFRAIEARHRHVVGIMDSVDATNVGPDLSGFRIVCNGFHHLAPATARECLQDAV